MFNRRDFLKLTAATIVTIGLPRSCQPHPPNFRYPSSIDMAITNLFAAYKYPTGGTNLPIVVLMHGWRLETTEFSVMTMNRIASYGLFALAVGMRGRNGADGTKDASAREIFDIVDAVEQVRTNFASVVDPNKVAIVGYSGGGGNALAAACKCPDYWNVVVSHFGMSDYGRNDPNGWYYNNGGGYTAEIATAVGDTPSNVPNQYYARDATVAIPNFSGGKLRLYHDKADNTVPWVHSSRIAAAMDAAGLSNYVASYTQQGDAVRWIHGDPDSSPDLITAEPAWSADILSQAAWTVPASGTVTVIGYIKTKRFTIWLNANGTASLGIDAAATVAYNTATDTYTVTPLTTGGVDVAITQGTKTGSATNITGATVITVA